MIFLIRKFARILAGAAFFCLLAAGLAMGGAFSWNSLAGTLMRSVVGASLFWIAGIILADILLKGVLSDIESSRDDLVDGGLLQQVGVLREKIPPVAPAAAASAANGAPAGQKNGTARQGNRSQR